MTTVLRIASVKGEQFSLVKGMKIIYIQFLLSIDFTLTQSLGD